MTHNLLALKAKQVEIPLIKRSQLSRLRCSSIFLAALSVLLLGFLLLAPSELLAQQGARQINSVRLWHSPDKTRVVFDVSENIKHKVFGLKNPERIVVDIENAGLKAILPTMQTENHHLAGMRTGSPQEGMLRFVFELKIPLQAHSFVLTPNELYGHRLVLDLVDTQFDPTSTDATGALNQSADSQAPTIVDIVESSAVDESIADLAPSTDVSTSSADQQSLSDVPAATVINEPSRTQQKITIAIDAGHGGEDPGASGHRGSREKEITLSIAKRLLKEINADSRMQAFLVREGDYYIDLTRRRVMAKEKGADIFVSIHADAFTKKSANGLSVFALSQRGATSAMARALAKKENAADLIGGVSLANKDAVLAKVLVDLSMTNTISESVNLGGRVLKELAKVGRLHSKRVEQASFAVLKSPDIPSILIETGFITNLNEEKKLRTSKYQKKIAKAIHTALGEYYEQTPYYSQANYSSPNIASSTVQNRASKRHTVKRGDSLSSIAFKYGTTVKELKRINKLRNNTAVLGQKLKLPGSEKVSQSARTSGAEPSVHIVKRGDSLSKISARYNVTISALKRHNGLSRDSVYKGQRIKIPGGRSPAKRDSKHKVTRGDTLSEIAEEYGVTIKAIMRANGLRDRTVRLGQILKIPG